MRWKGKRGERVADMQNKAADFPKEKKLVAMIAQKLQKGKLKSCFQIHHMRNPLACMAGQKCNQIPYHNAAFPGREALPGKHANRS